jgi:hypothetical protein
VAQTNSDYEWWEPLYQLPPRSILVPMKPMGLDSPYVESLSSYYLRLAYLHQLSPRGLAKYVILPALKISNLERLDFYAPHFNGAGKIPDLWTQQLQRFTGLKNLNQLTFSSLNLLLPKMSLFTPKKRWCPACHDESSDVSEMYDRLLWCIGAVSACPKHGINLVEKCACDPESRLPLINVKRLPGICMLCGGRLSSESAFEIQKAEEREIQRAQMVAEFIRDRRLVENIKIGINLRIMRFIRGIITNHTNGNASEFAKMVFLHKSQVSEWLQELHTPAFPQIVSIAQACGCSIADVYLGKYQHIEKVSPLYHSNRKPFSVPKKRKAAFKNVTEFQLNIFLVKEKPISLTQVAKTLNVSEKFLQLHFKDISLKIVDNYRKNRKTVAETRLSERCKEYRKTAETLFANGINPTRRRMIKELDIKMLIRHRKVFNEIVNEVTQAASKPT